MRGDSLRDLYAKTLALSGFGLLASIGAIIDYWPGRVDLPTVAEVRLSVGDPLVGLTSATLPKTVPVRLVPRTTTQPLSQVTPEPLIPVAETNLAQLAPELGSLESLDVVPFGDSDLAASPVTLQAPPVIQDPLPMAAPAARTAADQSWTDVVTGAFAKTGATIMKTGTSSLSRTATSIADAVRAAGGMFKRLF